MHKYLPNLFVFLDKFESQIFNNNTNIGVIYRNYKDPKREVELFKIAKACKKNRFKLFVSNDIKLAVKVRADGIYIPSFNKTFRHLAFSLKKNFKIIGSAHNIREIRNKELQNVEKIFLSSLFKKNNNFLGINKFKLLTKLTNKKVVALGGISKKNKKKLKLLNKIDFAGITYFE